MTQRQCDESCASIQALFSAALDDELTTEEKRAWQDHLQACQTCQQEWQQWQTMSSCLQEYENTCQLPENFADKVIQKIESQSKKKRFAVFTKHWRALASAAAAVALFAGSIGLMPHYTSIPKDFSPEIATINPIDKQNPGILPQEENPGEKGPQTGPQSKEGTGESAPKTEPGQVPQEISPGQDNSPTEETPKGRDLEPKTPPDNKEQTSPLPASDLVLLNQKELKVNNTLLKLAADNPAATIEQVREIAMQKGGTITQSTGKGGGDLPVGSITVTMSTANSDGFIQTISVLGKVINKTEESPVDLTYRYKDAVSRYEELSTLLKENKTIDASLQTEYTTLYNQIKDWQEQANKHTITIWVEKSK